MSTAHIAPCVHLEWDSQFFGRRIGKVVSSRMNDKLVEAIADWAKDARIECVYFLCSCAEHDSIRAACQGGYQLVDVRVTFERKPAIHPVSSDPDILIRRSCPEDTQCLKEIARSSHTDSRFYADTHFPKDSCDRLYEKWIEKCCNADDGCVFVASIRGLPVGYVSCTLEDGHEGSIGLIAVSSGAQRRGIGTALLDAADDWFSRNHCANVTVATQGSNLRAQRLYQRRGFVVRSMQLWFHRWF